MTYQVADGWTDVKFVRPAHALVALHGAEVVPVQALGLQAGRTTHGHRFEAFAADRGRCAARRSDGAGRAPERADLRLREGIPRGAAGVPDPHDEGQPEVL